ncbi:hypothetical protein CFP56_023047 [Quercus suber]|uniref:Uncharacterized protein n=1 Tax=Quercus suber TaxID=58331 RepID=A0AAW0KDF6_QUESU
MIALWFGTFTEWDRVIQSWDGEFGTKDKVLEVDKGKKSVRVEAGISVQQLRALKNRQDWRGVL